MQTVKEINPKIGMSVSMGINGDSYHEIIVKIERNSKTIYTISAHAVLGGMTLENWNAAPEWIKEKRAANALAESVADLIAAWECSEETAFRQVARCYTYRTTGNLKGRYVARGGKYCILTLDSQHHYLDPHF